MTKEECEIVKRLMDENEQLRARVKELEALTIPSPQQVPVYVPVPQIAPPYEPPWHRPFEWQTTLCGMSPDLNGGGTYQ
jgi:hypothetical protein